MIKNLKTYKILQLSKKYSLVSISLGTESIFYYFIAERKGDELELGAQSTVMTFEGLIQNLNIDHPIILHISGKGIISKVNTTNTDNKEKLFNSDPDDFFIYDFQNGDKTYTSMTRLDLIEEVINRFEEYKFMVVDVSIGPFIGILFNKISKLNHYKTRKHKMLFDGGLLIEYSKNDEDEPQVYTLGSEELSSYQIPVFSTLINHLYPDSRIEYDRGLFIHNKKVLKQRKIFKFAGLSVLLFFLLSLLVSYATIEFYKGQYLKYEEQLYYLNTTYAQVTSLEQERLEKQSIIDASGLLSDRFISSYIYDIARQVPDDIILNSLEINPIKKKVKDNEPIEMLMGTIEVSGSTGSSQTLNNWIKTLNDLEWTNNIEILSFLKDRNEILGFTIEIVYK